MLLAIFVIAFDQATKWSILAFIPITRIVRLLPHINFAITFNMGTSFGLLAPNTINEKYVMLTVIILCITLLTYVFFKLKSQVEITLCGLVLGGAISNLIDRFVHGAVVDFIDIYYGDWHWPAFNVADSFISGGAVLLILYNLFNKNER
jgi:signal peptidase II